MGAVDPDAIRTVGDHLVNQQAIRCRLTRQSDHDAGAGTIGILAEDFELPVLKPVLALLELR